MNRVLVLGNAGFDLGVRLPRLPAPGETLLGVEEGGRAPGGKGLNQAVAAVRAGAAVHLLAPLGHDAAAEEVAAALAEEGFAGLDLPRLPHMTDFSVLMVLPGGENSITGAGPCAAALPVARAAAFGASARAGDLLLVQGNLSFEATVAALEAAQSARTLLNPAPLWWDPAPLLPRCRIVVVNQGEAETISGEADPARAAAWLRAAGVELAIVTLGAAGCLAVDDAGLRRWPAEPVQAMNTTGCGDTFCGVLAAGLAAGMTTDAAIMRAQRAAAITASRPGAYAALPTVRELAG
jgi:ribokinase